MIRYVLDTDAFSLLAEGGSDLLSQRYLAQPPGTVATTVMTVEEVLTGWYSLVRQSKKRADIVHAYRRLAESVPRLAQNPILPYTEPALERYEQLKATKLRIGGMDLRIAAIALESRATVVTRNLRDFQRVPGLSVENWAV